MKKELKNIVIIVAAGQGRRMGRPKQFLKIAGQPMLFLTAQALAKSPLIDGIIVVVEVFCSVVVEVVLVLDVTIVDDGVIFVLFVVFIEELMSDCFTA